jgi:CobW/HypB/UreG, nucleotide-binding domain
MPLSCALMLPGSLSYIGCCHDCDRTCAGHRQERYALPCPDLMLNRTGWLQAVEQLAFADIVLLNKVDLVDAKEKAAVIKRIRV